MKPLIALILAVFCVQCGASAQSSNTAKPGIVQRLPGGEVDWLSQAFSATGRAIIAGQSEEPSPSKAYIKAKSQARTKAIANLLTAIDAVAVSYAAVGRDLTSRDQTLGPTIGEFAYGADVVSDRKISDAGGDVAEVSVRLPMYGPLGPGSAMLSALAQQERLGQVSAQLKVETPRPSVKTDAPADQQGPFTSVIVDTRGFRLQRAMNSRIRTADGSEVWGVMKSVPSSPRDVTGVIYASSPDDAKMDLRSGRNPLIVRAVGRAGGPVLCDAVVTTVDAERIVSEEKTGQFLKKCRVIFVVDPLVD